MSKTLLSVLAFLLVVGALFTLGFTGSWDMITTGWHETTAFITNLL